MDAYVYGVIEAGAAGRRRPPGGGGGPPGAAGRSGPRAGGPAGWRPSAEGVGDQPVELVERGELAALVSDAPRVPVKANRRNLMAHSRVLQSVIGERCVLPMRFGVVMPDRAAVEEELLAQNAEWLGAQLHVFETYVELDGRALCPEEELLRGGGGGGAAGG